MKITINGGFKVDIELKGSLNLGTIFFWQAN